jgi:hypothetical protein
MRLCKLTFGIALLAGTACGGEGGSREESQPFEPEPDPGSGPVFCPEADADGTQVFTDYAGRETRYSFVMLDDWETGAANFNWYTNNAWCTYCKQYEWQCNNPGTPLSEYDANTYQNTWVCPTEDEQATLSDCEVHCKTIQYPGPFEKPLGADEIPGGRCGSRFALHYVLGPIYSMSYSPFEAWGGVIGHQWPAPGEDVSEWDGLSFWGRAAPSSRKALSVDMSDRFTDAKAAVPECSGTHTLDHLESACDKFSNRIPMDGDWKLYTVPFADMRQGGYGHAAPYLDIAGLLTVGFGFDVGYWDVWIDDIAWYRLESR